jgi:hypothetical protein
VLVELCPNGGVHHLDGSGCGHVWVELFHGDARVDELLAPARDRLLNDPCKGDSKILRWMIRAEATVKERPVAERSRPSTYIKVVVGL